MRCKKCGKVMRKDEKFCEACGYYNGEKNNIGWDGEFEEKSLLDEPEEDENEFDDFDLKDNSESEEDEKLSGDEELLKAYIGEDYKTIKKIPFNPLAFLLNWSYFIYRKLYITGILGLIVTAIIAIFFKEKLLMYMIVLMIVLGVGFNFYYVFIAKRKVAHYKKKYQDTDKFGLVNICEEKGGVNLWFALASYLVFLLVIFFSYVDVDIFPDHNPKFFKENSENQATCSSIVKVGYESLETYKVPGTVEGAVCKVSKTNFTEYDVYIKTKKASKTYYAYYHAEDDGVMYKRNTSEIKELELKKAHNDLTEEEQALLNLLKQLENNYNDVSKQAKVEDELIEKKKNKSEKLNYVFSKEEIIR